MMSRDHLEFINYEGYDPKYNMPYVPAIKVHGGKTVYLAGMTAAPVYHSHPHVPSEFDHVPDDPGEQARMTMENIRQALRACGGDLEHIVQMTRFIVNIDENQDAINKVIGSFFGDIRPTSTTVEVTQLATDPRLVLEVTVVAVVPE